MGIQCGSKNLDSENNLMTDELKKEREIMQVMRKVLTSIVREVTPEHKSLQHPLSEYQLH